MPPSLHIRTTRRACDARRPRALRAGRRALQASPRRAASCPSPSASPSRCRPVACRCVPRCRRRGPWASRACACCEGAYSSGPAAPTRLLPADGSQAARHPRLSRHAPAAGHARCARPAGAQPGHRRRRHQARRRPAASRGPARGAGHARPQAGLSHRRRHPGAAGRRRHRDRPGRGFPRRRMSHEFAPPPADAVAADVARALAEDLGTGDVTAALLPDIADTAYLLCKESAVVCGRPWFDACHRALDRDVVIAWHVAEGDRVRANTVIATLEGRARALVSAERAALNFLQTLSGTATTTAEYVEAVRGTGAVILDTRKTIPGLRIAQKYAVRAGGGANHRMGLHDAVMLKENHVRAAGSIPAAIRRAREAQPSLPLIVEVETLQQLDEALLAGCERILIDDFDAASRREAVQRAKGRIPLEVSGGVDLHTVRAIAEDGVDYISIGGLTKHVRAIDLSMKLGRRAG